jgi:hypothetical protein
MSLSSCCEAANNDAALLNARTDCIELSEDTEKMVTSTIKALQHLLKRIAETKNEKSDADLPTDEPPAVTSAAEYLTHFSYGLKPGEARYIIYRFLKSNNMSIPKALEDLKYTAEFRRKQNLDRMALFPCLISMSGYDQPTMCEELGIPFIHNLTSGKRYVDAEGRLRLEQVQMDYYNVQYDELYANLTESAEHPACTPLSSFSAVNDSASGFDDMQNERRHHDPNRGREEAEWKAESRRYSMTNAHGNGADAHKKDGTAANNANGSNNDNNNTTTASAAASTTSGWRSLFSFHLFGHAKEKEREKEKRAPLGPTHSRTSSLNGKASDGHHLCRFHTSVSISDDSHRGSVAGSDVVADDQSATTQAAALLNPMAAGEALTGNPYNIFSESLNFHGILQPIVAVITKHIPFAFHCWDREGHPIMYCRLGRLNSKRLMRDLFNLTPIDAEPRALAVLFNTYALAVVWQLIRYCNLKNQKSNQIHDALLTEVQRNDHRSYRGMSSQSIGLFRKKAPIGSCVIVVDCGGLHLHNYLYKPLLVMVKSIVSMNVRHYPEVLHHAYITNCGASMSFAYLMIRNLLSEETRQKVTFCSRRNSASTLLEHISSDLLPQELGGKCQCLGGCIPSVTATTPGPDTTSICHTLGEARSSTRSLSSEPSIGEQVNDHLEESEFMVHRLHCTVKGLNLPPHGSRTLSFAMEAHTEIIWEFVVKKKQKTTFSAVFVSAADDGAMLSLVPRRRVQNDAGHYICPSIGTVIFRWSNKRSYFRRCRIHLKVYREEQTVASLET